MEAWRETTKTIFRKKKNLLKSITVQMHVHNSFISIIELVEMEILSMGKNNNNWMCFDFQKKNPNQNKL